ncbi:unnamed protein product [Caenorhabditis auriculariae]|uniref:Myb-like domain-containing protein n=1 Tax=Caenorhabditis auriculariae TaxID=2777116 RepID=A0A8S1GWE2_9PELO|nr:unnamed protein product [Caenorhabditis auriculariae]
MTSLRPSASDVPSTSKMEEAPPSTSFSRRRMAFRPPSGHPTRAVPLNNSSSNSGSSCKNHNIASVSNADAQAAQTLANMELINPSSMPIEKEVEETTRKRAAKSWTHEDVMAYYEGLKMHGKDFDSVVKVMAKRKVHKDKDQTKNYFFNSLKILKQLLVIDEEQMGDGPKDAKELFLSINACEWKKRTGSSKFISDRMRELLFDGSTTVRINKKSVVIKTPPCPSLLKFFSRSRRVDKFPADVTVEIKPKTYGDAAYVISRQQNPLIKLRISTNEKISRIMELLTKKWGPEPSETAATSNVNFRLWPDQEVEIGSLTVSEVDVSPSVALSFNKFKKEYEQIKATKKDVGSLSKKPSYTVLYPSPFVLTDEILHDGICAENIREAIVAELYCTCGMKETFELRYSLELSPQKNRHHVEPWEMMTMLLRRDYGESLCGKKDEEMMAANRKRERDRHHPEVNESHDFSEPPVKKGTRVSKNAVQEVAPREAVIDIPQLIESEIVQRENEEFEDQLLALQAKKKKRMRFNKAPAVKKKDDFVETRWLAAPLPTKQDPKKGTGYVSQFHARRAAAIIAKKQQEDGQKCVETPLQTDFSALSQKVEPQSAAAHFLDALRTPEKTPEKRVYMTPFKDERDLYSNGGTMDRLFGGDLSMSPGPRFTRSNEEQSTVHDAFDNLFGEISLTPSKFAQTNESQCGLAGFPEDVQQSFVDMMSQDSHDYVRLFEPLARRMEATPVKNKRL